jgi:hypothetical protein
MSIPRTPPASAVAKRASGPNVPDDLTSIKTIEAGLLSSHEPNVVLHWLLASDGAKFSRTNRVTPVACPSVMAKRAVPAGTVSLNLEIVLATLELTETAFPKANACTVTIWFSAESNVSALSSIVADVTPQPTVKHDNKMAKRKCITRATCATDEPSAAARRSVNEFCFSSELLLMSQEPVCSMGKFV